MTRINLVPPQELYDQHLFAEWREIKMVPMSLRRSIRAHGVSGVLKRIPKEFCLNIGHVTFFYDKGHYLWKRYLLLTEELKRRHYIFDYNAPMDPLRVFWTTHNLVMPFMGDYTPTQEALVLIRERIASKVAMKPDWYRYEGVALAPSQQIAYTAPCP